jgi:hypothetical protein
MTVLLVRGTLGNLLDIIAKNQGTRELRIGFLSGARHSSTECRLVLPLELVSIMFALATFRHFGLGFAHTTHQVY